MRRVSDRLSHISSRVWLDWPKLDKLAIWVWVLQRRKFVDVHRASGSAITEEAIRRVAQLYAIEKTIRGKPPDERTAVRQARSRPIFGDIQAWLHAQLTRISGKSPLAAAIRYALTRMKSWSPGSCTASPNWTTVPPSARCVRSPWAARTSCSPARDRRCLGYQRRTYPPQARRAAARWRHHAARRSQALQEACR